MTEATPLDLAHAAMEAAPEQDDLRLRYFERLVESELFLLLEAEPVGDAIEPRLLDLGEVQYVLLFDRIERLAAFASTGAPYAALSGRSICQLLAGQGIGLGINLEVAESAWLIPAAAVNWLNETLAHVPREVSVRPREVHPPGGLPETLIQALDSKLATATGLAGAAWLVSVGYDSGARTHLLGFVDTLPGAEGALARAVGEALTFSGIEAGMLDVGFFQKDEPITAALARSGLRFDLPSPLHPEGQMRPPPGSDPDKPPRLR